MSKKLNFFVLILAISIPYLHEVGHFIGYCVDGIPSTIEYAFTHPSNSNGFWGIIGGPLFNIILSSITLLMAYINEKNSTIWNTISISSSVGRSLNNIIILFISLFNNIVILSNDEGEIAALFNCSPYLIYFSSILIHAFLISKAIKNKLLLKVLVASLIYAFIISMIIIFFY